VADRYRLVELVGRGATAQVWRARDELLARVDGLLRQDAARYGDVLGAASALVSGDELRAAADRIATVLQ